MKLSLAYGWDCTPEAFWALYFDPDFAVRLHLEGLGSTSAEVVSQEGDLSSGLVRTLRYGQRPNMPGPVRKIFGEEVVDHRGQHLRPGDLDDDVHHDAGHHGRQDAHRGRHCAVTGEGGNTVETFSLDARVKIFGAGPIVERFIEHQARDMQEKAVAFMRAELEGMSAPVSHAIRHSRLEVEVLLAGVGDAVDLALLGPRRRTDPDGCQVPAPARRDRGPRNQAAERVRPRTARAAWCRGRRRTAVACTRSAGCGLAAASHGRQPAPAVDAPVADLVAAHRRRPPGPWPRVRRVSFSASNDRADREPAQPVDLPAPRTRRRPGRRCAPPSSGSRRRSRGSPVARRRPAGPRCAAGEAAVAEPAQVGHRRPGPAHDDEVGIAERAHAVDPADAHAGLGRERVEVGEVGEAGQADGRHVEASAVPGRRPPGERRPARAERVLGVERRARPRWGRTPRVGTPQRSSSSAVAPPEQGAVARGSG